MRQGTAMVAARNPRGEKGEQRASSWPPSTPPVPGRPGEKGAWAEHPFGVEVTARFTPDLDQLLRSAGSCCGVVAQLARS